ncbi:MAG: molybdopterin molybdotransferase MoeA [Gordonia sp. (in: high G+C Gram-positive bacteria)]|uniref:molybdopterin molybdotransferase MoeA n=1 Tax=Gordonia sp. (in: high G+C Gram-positive bacteria) TaxID=84139 RepID=UPI0039E6AE51
MTVADRFMSRRTRGGADYSGRVIRRPVAEHRAAVGAHLAGIRRTEKVPVAVTLGRVTARPVHAPYSLPLFDNSAMDGFAVRASEVRPGVVLPVSGRVFAGDAAPESLPAGSATAIMTGAPLPRGADAVVPVEQTVETDGRVRFESSPEPGAFVRSAGDDVRAGARVVDARVTLTPRHLGALAASGVAAVEVIRRPTVAVISTGSELIRPGCEPSGGQIFESNSLVLTSLAAEHGAQVVYVAAARDDGDFDTILTAACLDADLVLTSGGISMGEREPVRQTLGEYGWFGPTAMQPGGPQGLALWHGTPVICFPGNPVSVIVSFEVLLRDHLRELAGLPPIPCGRARLGRDVTSVRGKTQFLRGVLGDDESPGVPVVEPIGGPGSHLAVTAAAADLLIEIDADVTHAAAGTEVTTWPLT